MLRVNYLFSDGDLWDFLENRKRELLREIQNTNSDYLLNVNLADFYNYLTQKYSLDAPVLDEDGITVDQNEINIDVSQYPNRFIPDRRRPHYIRGTQLTYFVPFNGDQVLFKYKPSTFTYAPPQAIVKENELHVLIDGVNQDAEKVKQEFNRELNEIKKWAGWVEKDVKQFNENLVKQVEKEVQKRREKILKDKNLVVDLGFPLKKRKDAPLTYTVPEVRRKIIPRPIASKDPYKQEPTVGMEDYEHILNIITNMSLVMERSPKAFKNMDEEDIRQHFLVQLNDQYEGQATGETFNFKGKTDILIRHKDKNLFIAECKFWHGKEKLKETIGQILGYVSWRDTKTAVLIFNRTKNLSNVLSQIPAIVKNHPNFKEELDYNSETGFRFILHHKDDKDRNLYLTILVFEVPT